MRHLLIACLLVTGVCLHALEENGETVELGPKAQVIDPKIKALVDQLGAADTVQREDAEKVLSGMGKLAAAALKEGEKSPNPEVAARAKRIGARLADTSVRPESYAEVFPADSILFLEFNDAEATVERMKSTPLGKLWDKQVTKSYLEAYRAGLPNASLKQYDAASALPKLMSGKFVYGLGGPETIEPHEIEAPLLFVMETKNLPAAETQVRIFFEGVGDAIKNTRQYKTFQIHEQSTAQTVFSQGRIIHGLTPKGMEGLLDNLTKPPAKPLSGVLAALKKERPKADVYVRLAANGLTELAEANQILDEDLAKKVETVGFEEGSFIESALTLNPEGVEELTRVSLTNGAKNKGLLAVLQRMALKPAPLQPGPKAAMPPQALDIIPFQAAMVVGFSGDVAAHSTELAVALRAFDGLFGEPLHADPTLPAPVQPVQPNAPVQPPKAPTRAEEALQLGGSKLGKEPAMEPMKEAKTPKMGKKAAKQEPERSTPHLERLAKAGLTLETLFSQSDGPMYVALFPERIDVRKIQNPNAPDLEPEPDHVPIAALFAMYLKDPAPVALALEKANVGLQPRYVKSALSGGDYYADDDEDGGGGFWIRGNYFAYATSRDIMELAGAASLNHAGTERIASRKAYVDYMANGYDPAALVNVFADSRQFLEMPYNFARLQWDDLPTHWPDFSVVAGVLKGNSIRIKVKQVNGVLQIEAQTPLSLLGMIEALRVPLTESGLIQ